MTMMNWLPRSRKRRTEELAEELRTHLEMATADRIARGETPEAAALNARREFGNPGLVQEISRDKWGSAGMWIERCMQDIRFALRVLRRDKGFTLTAVLTIALGIGATTALFSVADATLLRRLPYPHDEQLVRIEDDFVGTGARDVGISTPEWRDLERSDVFTYVSPTWYDDNNLTGVSHAQRVSLLIVAPNYFTMLGVKPQLGTTFDPKDGTPGFNEQCVISDGLWKRAFGSDPHVIGRIVQIDSDSYRIVGVMPPGFQAPERTGAERGTEVWSAFGFAGKPFTATDLQRHPVMPGAIARIKPTLTIDEAQRRVDVLVRTLRAQYPEAYPPAIDWHIRLVPLRTSVSGDARQSLLFLFGAVVLVALIGCTNVANLLLARGTARGRELAVRQALGGATSRLIRQLLTESVVLSMVGGVVGVMLLLVAHRWLVRLVPANVPRLNDISIDWRVLVFAFAVSLVAGAIFGLAPAWQVRRLDVTRVLKQEGRGMTGSREQTRIRHLLVVLEFTLALVLMIAASLLLHSFWDLTRAPLGFNPRDVTVVHTRLPYPNDPNEDRYATAANEEPFVRELLRRASTLPGVEDVALGAGGAVPLDHPQQDQEVLRVLFEGRPAQTQLAFVNGAEVTPGFFRLLGIPLVRGRLFSDFETDRTPPVVVINEAMARAYWPNEKPIGKRLQLSQRSPVWSTVVGIVANARTESLSNAAVPQLYSSIYQRRAKHLAIFLRGHFETGAIARGVQEQVQAVNRALPVFGAETLSDAVSSSLARRRFAMELIALFAATALLLACIGVYGVITYMVSERTHEIGVRVALGASRGDIVSRVLRQGLRLALVGSVAGLAVSLVVGRLMSSMLYGVTSHDPLTFAAATLMLGAAAVAACYVPARRALQVDPAIALRS